MKGQWIGLYTGDVSGKLLINIDEINDHFEGEAYVIPTDKNIPSSAARFSTANKDNEQDVQAFIDSVDPRSGYQCDWDDIKHLYDENVVHSNESKVHLHLKDDKLHISSVSDLGIKLESILVKPIDTDVSKITGKIMTWDEFKNDVSLLSGSKHLFRGQRKPWRLRTSFHRRERYRIGRFITHDVKSLHQKLSAITSHYFDLNVPEQNGAFFNLLQHHGYPTPLLDWSYSPYVAAFFAFRNVPMHFEDEGYVRIYIFNNEAWQQRYPQVQNINPPFPHLSVMDFIAINNPRLVPQQSVTTVTNIDDIEDYLLEKETESSIKYLQAIDILASDRSKAMRDLRFMGITAGSMFPSIDGVCEEQRECNFG